MSFTIDLIPRKISVSEKNIVYCLLRKDTPLQRDLRYQLEGILVRTSDANGSIYFETSKSDRFPGKTGLCAEANYADSGVESFSGDTIDILLFIKNGNLDELKIFKQNGGVVNELPDCKNIFNILDHII